MTPRLLVVEAPFQTYSLGIGRGVGARYVLPASVVLEFDEYEPFRNGNVYRIVVCPDGIRDARREVIDRCTREL